MPATTRLQHRPGLVLSPQRAADNIPFPSHAFIQAALQYRNQDLPLCNGYQIWYFLSAHPRAAGFFRSLHFSCYFTRFG